MSNSPSDGSAWPSSLALHVDAVCNRFEAAWRAGGHPRIEAYLSDTPEPGRSELLRELLALELEYRRGRGDTPTPEEYHARFPGHDELVRNALAGARTTGLQVTGSGDAGARGAGAPCPTGGYEATDTTTGAPEREGSPGGAAGKRGRFTPLRQHAQGGLGTVSVAFDETLRRQVALKEIRPDRRGNAHLRRRFLTEAEITGQLEHPGVVPVYALEEDADGQPYYAMRFVQGRTLAEAIQAYHRQPTPLAFHALLKRFVDVCQTVAYAHSRGVIHRDLKPANVMLGDFGETLVVDWGLAKRVRGSPGTKAEEAPETARAGSDAGGASAEALTEAGQVLGTPAYMSPEQAEGQSDGVGPATDIYALGAILYEVLTGQPPYRGAGLGAVLTQVRRGSPPAPTHVRRGVPRALAAVCLKAMARSPADRYPGAGEVAREVERWLADQPVTAYREPLPVRLARWTRRHRTPVAVAGFVLLTLIGAAVIGGLVVNREQDRSRALAQVDALPNAAAASVPALLADLAAHRDTVRPGLLAKWQDPTLSHGQLLRVGLALADDAEVRAQLLTLAPTAADPHEVLLVRNALAPYAGEVTPLMWTLVAEPSMPPRERFCLLAILASMDPDSDRWPAQAANVVSALVRENVLFIGGWAEALRPVGGQLIPPLADVFRDANRPELERGLATGLLAEYAADQPEMLADLLTDADVKQFAVLYLRFKDQEDRGLRVLTGEVDRRVPEEATASDKERLAKRQANAAVALLRMGHAEKVWPLLKHSPDPTVRSYLIHRLGPLGADAGAIVEQLGREGDVTIQRALVLSLGPEEFGEQTWTLEGKQPLVEQLQGMYCTAPDPGLHAAAEWLLRQWKEEAWIRETDEALAADKDKRLQDIKHDLLQERENARPKWYVNGQGQTMVVIPSPGEFLMGSPVSGAGSLQRREQLHRRRIGYSYAIAAKPVTVEQFLRFREDEYSPEIAPTKDCPMHAVSWYMAAEYCNWLSKREGIPEGDWCYEPNKEGKYEDGMRLAPDYRKRTGYRLPTEAEWEYSCRAGASTSRYYGASEHLLTKYGWYWQNSRFRSWPVGSLKPNDLGLFDMHGNVWCWCQDLFKEYPETKGQEAADVMEDTLMVTNDQERVLRGGSFDRPPPFVRCAWRDWNHPWNRFSRLGFRATRTIR
jgi:formylglycine-generating enzyme required for sulfatase activity/tRNA A-37 threonylcarbamoyl transferase component Bud32